MGKQEYPEKNKHAIECMDLTHRRAHLFYVLQKVNIEQLRILAL